MVLWRASTHLNYSFISFSAVAKCPGGTICDICVAKVNALSWFLAVRLVEQRCNKPNSMIGYIRMQRVKIMPTEVPVSGVMEHCFVKGFLATPATFSSGSVSKLMQFANQRGLVNFTHVREG